MPLYLSTNAKNRLDIDLNNDGIVDSKDLSLFLQALTR